MQSYVSQQQPSYVSSSAAAGGQAQGGQTQQIVQQGGGAAQPYILQSPMWQPQQQQPFGGAAGGLGGGAGIVGMPGGVPGAMPGMGPMGGMNTLYYSPYSPNSLGPWMLIALNNLPVRGEQIDLMKAQQKEDWFLKINPCHCIPTYRASNGYALWESNAVLRFIVNTFPQLQQWYPLDPHVRGKIDTALDWRQTTLYQKTTRLGYPQLGYSTDTSGQEEAMKGLEADWAVLRYFLGGFPFIGGLHPSIADISILTAIKIIDCRNDIKIPEDMLTYVSRLERLLSPRAYSNVWGKYDELSASKKVNK